ncbi:MAG: glycosyltransferase family 4 protein [Planctomycetota bacterium]
MTLGVGWFPKQPGGLNRYVHGLHGSLGSASIDQKLLLVAGESEEIEAREEVASVAGPDEPVFRRLLRMRGAVRASLPDADLAVTHFALYARGCRDLLRDRPHVVHFHGPWAAESSREGLGRIATHIKHRVERAVYRTGDRFITLSNAFADILAKDYGVDRARITIIPGGVDIERFDASMPRADARAQLGWPSDRPIVVCVRRLVARMGLESLMDATATLRERHPDVLVQIIGKGRLADALERRVREAGLADHVELLGYMPDEQLPLAYRAADLSVVPTQALEGFGLIVAESLAAGTPALVTPVGGLPEVVQDWRADLVMPGTSSDVIAHTLAAALSGEMQMPTAEQCRAYAVDRFAWDRIAGQVAGVYRQAVDLSK